MIAALSWDHDTMSTTTTNNNPTNEGESIVIDIDNDGAETRAPHFQRSSKTVRSPIQNTVTKMETAPPPAASEKEPEGGKEKDNEYDVLMVRLGKIITELSEFVKPRNNIHNDIKKMVSSVRRIYESAREKRIEATPKPQGRKDEATKECQTSPIADQESSKGQKKEAGAYKRKRSSPKGVVAAVKRIRGDRTPLLSSNETPKTTEKSEPKNLQGEWKTVEKKKKAPAEKEREPRQPKTRPDALLIKKGGQTFADILKKVKSDSSLDGLGEKVVHIRKTLGGDLLLELTNKGEINSVSTLRDQLAKAVGEENEVKTLSPEATIAIRDLDEITTQNEVLEALEKKFENLKGTLRIRSLRSGHSGTQTAIVSMPKRLLPEVMKEGKIKIGWVSCRIKEKVVPLSCYKCFEYGHRALECKSAVDRSKWCKNCSETGHIAKECKNQPKCAICSERKIESRHGTGSFRCPAYQQAMRKTR